MSSSFAKYKYIDTISKKNKLARFIWNFVWLFLFRSNPRWCLNSWRIFLLKVFGAKIGIGCKISPTCTIWAPWNLIMGDYSALGENVNCYSMNLITIGSKVAISEGSFLCTGTHDISSLLRPLITKPIFINDHAWVCAEAFIGPGVKIEEGGIVGARGVVTKDVPEWTVVAGNPATQIKKRILSGN